ncbi:MAG: GIY-YIG nuclease family protein [Brevundimonas sp.]|uniref:GIY-YIG nuclease family protein n=1 Tax=Brevundimonas sp. TaxID=1871086 RepID=UPI00271E803E|nr:GIY-YIG nuclease family protein [Brevundimonas sp.]MDO9076230.1 GIY-YIG nuclease family protein [Brevundimonas sp.]MDP3079747.1 GIY-YIG nuclease family protein [Brevundimonas sp.]MDZ4062162.1 GIY-YIG nuclease family protein [Brevundimonas sp.]
MREHDFWVYILASGPCGWLYVGMTNDLIRRVGEHRSGQFDSYTREHGINQLVWFERHQYVDQAILREKRIKRWLRAWKFALIEDFNPRWLDLYGEVAAGRLPAQPKGAVRED